MTRRECTVEPDTISVPSTVNSRYVSTRDRNSRNTGKEVTSHSQGQTGTGRGRLVSTGSDRYLHLKESRLSQVLKHKSPQ